jgi:hypothetical protein
VSLSFFPARRASAARGGGGSGEGGHRSSSLSLSLSDAAGVAGCDGGGVGGSGEGVLGFITTWYALCFGFGRRSFRSGVRTRATGEPRDA